MVTGFTYDIEEALYSYLGTNLPAYTYVLEGFNKNSPNVAVSIQQEGTFNDRVEIPVFNPRVKIVCRAASKQASKTMAEAVRKKLHGLVSTTVGTLDVALIRLNSGILFEPDEDNGLYMHIAFYEVLLKGTAG